MDADLAEEFEEHRGRLRALALRMLNSRDDAEDAVQEAWMPLDRAGRPGIDNLGGWLTTVTVRICLNALRCRGTRREILVDPHEPDPVVRHVEIPGPEDAAVVADDVGGALLVVLETLAPPERLAFVLHDVFAVPFDEIAVMLKRSPEAARQLASRARRRLSGVAIAGADLPHQRQVVDAFFAAARAGDFARLVSVLHPDVVLRSEGGAQRQSLSALLRGAQAVADRALSMTIPDAVLEPVLLNGRAGVVVTVGGQPFAVMGFTVLDGTIAAIEVLADPHRIGRLALPPI